tara:strand:- start:309 stop:599 length:291 start_codon:yes stop_codon:yes gene_type:complete
MPKALRKGKQNQKIRSNSLNYVKEGSRITVKYGNGWYRCIIDKILKKKSGILCVNLRGTEKNGDIFISEGVKLSHIDAKSVQWKITKEFPDIPVNN